MLDYERYSEDFTEMAKKASAPRLDTTQYRPKVLIAMIRTKHYVRNWIEILTIQMLNLNNGN